MGPEGAARLLQPQGHRGCRGPGQGRGGRFIAEYKEKFFNPYQAADVGQIDEVIEPARPVPRLVRALEVLRTKVTQTMPKKHGLFPV
jgi:acetyl-CoA carboxylase carboxyltransferase component